MGQLHLKNVVLPSVLVASTLFSALTLPFIASDPNPIAVHVPPIFEGEFQPLFKGEDRGDTIRYIGFSIVISVTAGIATVELLRRIQNSSPSLPEQHNQIVPLQAELQPIEFTDSLRQLSNEEIMDLEDELAEFSDALTSTDSLTTANSELFVWNDERYRFVRVRQTQEKAVSIAKWLVQRGEQVIITELEQGYAVWVKEML